MPKKAKNVLIGAVLLLDLQSFAALGRHLEKYGGRRLTCVVCQHRDSTHAGVSWTVLVKRGVDLLP